MYNEPSSSLDTDPPLHTSFDQDTAIREIAAGRYEAELHPRWWVLHGPNGGYLAAIILRALTQTVSAPGRHVRSITVHFVAPAREGTIELQCGVERVGGSLTTASARLEQQGRLLALALAAFSKPFENTLEHDVCAPPSMPAPESLATFPEDPGAPAVHQAVRVPLRYRRASVLRCRHRRERRLAAAAGATAT